MPAPAVVSGPAVAGGPPLSPWNARKPAALQGRIGGSPVAPSFDAHANFAYSTVVAAPTPADTGGSVMVQPGEGARFPAAPFNASVWPAGTQPLVTNAEVVRVTAAAADTLYISRAQEGSVARSIIAGDQIAETITSKALTDLEARITAIVVPPTPALVYLGIATPGASGTIDLPDIDQRYSDLLLVMILRGSSASAATSAFVRFNGDTGNNYQRQQVTGQAASAGAAFANAQSSAYAGNHPSASATANFFGCYELWIHGYSNSSRIKTYKAINYEDDAANGSSPRVGVFAGLWNSVAAINRIQVFDSTAGATLVTGSELRWYGRP